MLAGGTTVAVLGCGLGTRYLMQNEPLRAEIRSHGALVTEFRPFTPAGKHTFPLRNRLISGMSEGLLVVEAGSHSGSLITARCALEQGRDVYAVPGSVLSTDFAGTNDLSSCWRRSRTRAPTCPKPLRSTILNGWRRGGSG